MKKFIKIKKILYEKQTKNNKKLSVRKKLPIAWPHVTYAIALDLYI